MHRSLIRSLSLALLALALFGAQASAQDALRAWGLTGSSVARSQGLEAVSDNPALLADPGARRMTFGLASLGLDLNNNSFSLSRYNETSGAELDAADKQALLDDVPAGGLRMDAGVDVSALGFRYGRFALSTRFLGRGGGTMDKDYLELVLLGNEIDQAFSFDDTEAQGFALGGLVASYAHPVYDDEWVQLDAGLNVHYLYGIYEFRTLEAAGGLVTTMAGLDGSARAHIVTAEGGSGYAADLGLACRWNERWRAGLVWEGLLRSMTWDRNVEHQLWTVDAEGLALGEDDMDEAVVDRDSTWAGDAYSGTLPSTLRLGLLRESDVVTLAAETEIRVQNLQGASTGLAMMLGAEWRALSWLRPRLGLGIGESAKGVVTGLGMGWGFFRADLYAGTRGGYWPSGTHGLAMGSAFSLNF